MLSVISAQSLHVVKRTGNDLSRTLNFVSFCLILILLTVLILGLTKIILTYIIRKKELDNVKAKKTTIRKLERHGLRRDRKRKTKIQVNHRSDQE